MITIPQGMNAGRNALLGMARDWHLNPRSTQAAFERLVAERKRVQSDLLARREHQQVEYHAMLAARAWLSGGLQSVNMPHKYAAALACTDCISLADSGLNMPWPAFEVRVPNGLIPIAGTDDYVECVLCSPISMSSGAVGLSIITATTKLIFITKAAALADLIGRTIQLAEDASGAEAASAYQRAVAVANRLLASVVVDLASIPPGTTHREPVAAARVDKMGIPSVNTLQIGRALNVDCRGTIREYLNGGRGTPSVTTLVRGHFRNQAHGKGHQSRKIIWVQPFFRGDGPMLVRPTRLGLSAEEAAGDP